MNIEEFYANPNEKPLDRLVGAGSFCAVFRTIGCIGDSLSSGEFESTDANGNKGYHDMFDYSWGQYLARLVGTKVLNFSRGGMSASEYCDGWADANGFWSPAYACQAYIIALGCNDLFGMKQPVGSIDDVCMEDWHQNKATFAGHYAKIIQRLKLIQPRAHFFLMTLPRDTDNEEHEAIKRDQAKLLYDFSERFENTYVLDLNQYAPVYDDKFKQQFFMSGHMNPAGYQLTALMVSSYIDYIVRNNMEQFKETGYIGTDLHA